MTLFTVVFTAFFGTASVQQFVLSCEDVVCVADAENRALEAPEVTRVRVWRTPEYAPLPAASRYVWPPIADLTHL